MDKNDGWTNYATQRINSALFDDMSADDFSANELTASEFSEIIREYAKDIIFSESGVNWHEIAQHLLNKSNNGRV